MKSLLTEYYITLKSEDSGLPIDLWIDNVCAYKTSGHNGSYRLKIQPNPAEKITKNFVPMLLPSCEIVHREKISYPDSMLEKVKEFAQKNMDFLMYLSENPTSKEEVYKNLINVDGFKILSQDIENQYKILDNISHNGFRRVQRVTDNLMNFIDDENHLISNTWFVNVTNFEKYNGKDYQAFVTNDNNIWFKLSTNCQLEKF